MSQRFTIIHPTDFSEHANLAFTMACSMARVTESRLLALHVMSIPLLHTKWGYREEMEEALRRPQRMSDQVAVEYRLEEGGAAFGILNVARECQSDLIVMGTQGRTGLDRLLMGSVAEHVVRNAPCPVLTVKAPISPVEGSGAEAAGQGPTVGLIGTILHPTDFSEPCNEAFRIACLLAKDHAAQVIVVHVPEPWVETFGMAPSPPLPAGYRGGLEARLGLIQSSVPDVRVKGRVEEGEPAAGILSAAQATECDLIVMGTHGRTGLERLLMGSVAENVLRTSPYPVVTVKTPHLGSEPLSRVEAVDPGQSG